jgi:glycosyltransferase involved in cell wall biosynthesis
MIPVLWLTHVYPRHAGDMLGSFLHRLARELPARGYAPHVLAPAAEGVAAIETREGVAIRRFGSARDTGAVAYTGEMHRAAMRHPIAFYRFLEAMRTAVREALADLKPAVLHSHWWFPSGWMAAEAVGRSTTPASVLSLHGTDLRLLSRVSIAAPLAQRVFSRMDRILPVSSYLADVLVSLGAPRSRTAVLPMPADASVFRPEAAAPARTSDFVLAARLVPQKRADLAIRGLAHARNRGADARLHIVGDGPEREPLSDLARTLDCLSAVVFHGTQPPEALAKIFRSCAAALLPSEREGYGLVLVEAALCETPGIGARSGAIPEIVVPGESGWLVEPGDWKGIGDAMLDAIRDPLGRERLGHAARDRALHRTAPQSAERLAAVYRDFANGSARR